MNKATPKKHQLNAAVRSEIIESLFDILAKLEEKWHPLRIHLYRMRQANIQFAEQRLAAVAEIGLCLQAAKCGACPRRLITLLESALQKVNLYSDAVASRCADMSIAHRLSTEGQATYELYGTCSQALLSLGILIEAVRRNRPAR